MLNIQGEVLRIQIEKQTLFILAGHRLYGVEFFNADATTNIDLTQFCSVVQHQNLTNPSASIDGVVPPVGAVTLGNIGVAEEMRDSVLQITYNLFTGTRTQTPESGTVQKLLPPGEDGSVFITGPTGSISGVFTIPDPNVSNPAFKTGERQFRLTSSKINEADDVNLEGVETYAKVFTLQEVS